MEEDKKDRWKEERKKQVSVLLEEFAGMFLSGYSMRSLNLNLLLFCSETGWVGLTTGNLPMITRKQDEDNVQTEEGRNVALKSKPM